MRLLGSCESWSLTYGGVRIANGGEYSEMSDEYVEHLKTFFEEFYGEKVEIVYIGVQMKRINKTKHTKAIKPYNISKLPIRIIASLVVYGD
jgi:hypothetical protein